MTDEKLIEEAAKAMASLDPGQVWEDCQQDWYLRDARAALAVFEKAHAPTGYRAILIQKAREHADEWRRYDDTEELVGTLVEMANMLAAHDAEVRASVVAEEPEWEYGSAGYCFDWDDRRCRWISTDLVGILRHEEEAHGGNPSYPRRRRSAGPWLPVKQGGSADA